MTTWAKKHQLKKKTKRDKVQVSHTAYQDWGTNSQHLKTNKESTIYIDFNDAEYDGWKTKTPFAFFLKFETIIIWISTDTWKP